MTTRNNETAVLPRVWRFRGKSMSVPLDMRYGLRRLNNNVGFTIIAVSCLALGICASITVFSVVNALLLRPIPGVVEQDRLVSLMSKPVAAEGFGDELTDDPLSYPVLLRYQRESRAFSGLVAYQSMPVNLVVGSEPLRARGQVVTDNYFSTLGLQPFLGHFFGPGEGTREAQPQAIISHALWQRSFRRQVIGSSVSLNGHPFVVAGVAPQGFRGPQLQDEVDVWVPIDAAPLILHDFSASDLRNPERAWLFGFFGRLAPGIDRARAQRELDHLASRLGSGLPADKRPPGLQLYQGLKIRPGTQGAVASPLALLAGVVGLLMLVVCANLGGLLLVKAAARQEEIGVRLALGVTRGQLIRQLLTESVTLSIVGGAAGFVLSLWTIEALQGVSLGRLLPRIRDLSVDGRVVAFTVVVSLSAGVLFGLVPALWSTRRGAAPLLHRGSDSAPDRGRTRLQEMFVVGQVTVSLLLLVTTGLFVRTLRNLQSIDPGFDSTNVLNVRLNLALQGKAEPFGRFFYDQLLGQVRRIPGAGTASLVSWVPLSPSNEPSHLTVLRAQSAAGTGAKEHWSQYSVTVPGYFANLKIARLRGREFSPADVAGSKPVLIVNEILADRLWPGRDPIGERVELRRAGKNEVREVVGVVPGVRLRSLQEKAQNYFYLPLAQCYEPAMTLQVRSGGDPLATVDLVRGIARKLEPNLGLEVGRYDQEVQEALSQPRLLSWLLGSFSLTALLVTAIGLYGTLAYAVSRRTRELGIRIALGARSHEIVTMVLRRGLGMTVTGLILGLTLASWTTTAFAGLLFGVTPTDPGVFVSVAILLTLVGLAASSLPAYSATRVDPMGVIRHE